MLRSAIAPGWSTTSSPPEEMPARLVEYARTCGLHEIARAAAGGARGQLARICALLRRHTGHDFSQYKQHPHPPHPAPHAGEPDRLGRRLRRAAPQRSAGGGAALQGPAHRRDPLLPRSRGLRRARARGAPAAPRPAPGPTDRCASGCRAAPPARRPTRSPSSCARRWQRRDARPRVQIFATDIDDEALEVARQARYPRAASPSTSRPSGSSASSSGRTAATRSRRSSARCASSPRTT